MKINVNFSGFIKMKFGNLSNGNCFLSGFDSGTSVAERMVGGPYYIKMDVWEETGQTCNAVDIVNGDICIFRDDDIVDYLPKAELMLFGNNPQ